MKVRGNSDNLGVGDNIVNQVLAKIDGVEALNNILVIGMTNRKDMIDPAILRPGRMEVHIEVPLPNKEGREQILRIKTKKMKDNKMIAPECIERLPELAGMIENFTGAEVESFVSHASKYVLSRNIDGTDVGGASQNPEDYVLQWSDFIKTVQNNDVVPQFGNKPDDDLPQYFSNDIINYGEAFEITYATIKRLLNQVKASQNTPVLSVLLEGHAYTGKTAIAAKLACESGFPYIRMITPDMFIGMSPSSICEKIQTTFTDSYKSKLSIIILDDIERIIGYAPVGPRFNVDILQTLMVMIRKRPSIAGNRLFVMGTTSVAHDIEDLGLVRAFTVSQHISQLQNKAEFETALQNCKAGTDGTLTQAEITDIAGAISQPIGIKQLLETLEMAMSEAGQDNELTETEKEKDNELGVELLPTPTQVSATLFLSCLHVRGF